jgi:hypothetical protein
VLAFEEINRLSREVLIKTKDIVQRLGYEMIYVDTGSALSRAEVSESTAILNAVITFKSVWIYCRILVSVFKFVLLTLSSVLKL